jgi:hypothetical protein
MNVHEFIRESCGVSDLRFPGPQPVSIERRHFPLLKRQPYFVCEKTDGVRYLLASTEEGVYLVNRAFKTESVKIRVPKDTLFDGELVQTKTGNILFMIHDAIRVKGENLLKAPLDQRLEAAKKGIKGMIKTSQAPFEIRVKTMYLWGSQFPPSSFEYETDGLVFTPINEPIRSGTHETMFKWKPREKITIDFEIRNGKELYVQDRGVPYKESELNIKNEIHDGAIVECGYGSHGFFVEKIRTDKTHANNRRTYFRTMINLRENIQLSEFIGLYQA